MIMISAQMRPRSNRQNEFLDIIKTLIPNVEKQVGCINFHFFRAWRDENTYLLLGYWRSWILAEAHLKSDEFALLINAFALLEAPPEVTCSYIAPENGLALIQKIRSGAPYSFTK